jgi:polysaccharide deacetylase family protein (PEP-CTERM system associated)
MRNALSIDVEEHFQVHAFASVIRPAEWEQHQSRVVVNTERILDLLATHQVRATFFVLGWVADRHPNLVRAITAGGHEIGTHGYWHRLVYEQTPVEFAEDLARSLAAIKRACSDVTVLGYRAPAFSVTKQSLWALDILREQKLTYDSSIFPLAYHDRYGIPDAQRFAHQHRNGLWEFPVSTLRFGQKNVPVAGGGYFRIYPLTATRYAIRRLHQEQRAAVVYLHPWEFDPTQPRIAGASLFSRFRHYTNLAKTYERLKTLLTEFQFAPMQEVFASQLTG